MTRALPVLLLMVASVLTLPNCSRTAPIQDPAPAVANPDLDVTRGAVHYAIGQSGWTVTEEKPGEVVARLNVRTHMIMVQVSYDANTVAVQYRDSRNMKHSGDAANGSIHKNYNVWVRQLMDEIERALASKQRYPAPPMGAAVAPSAGVAPAAGPAPAGAAEPPAPIREEPPPEDDLPPPLDPGR